LQCKRASSYTMVIYMVAYSHGSGLSPSPTPLSNINKCKYKYNMACLSNKKHMTDGWLAKCFKRFGYGGGPGVEPRGPIHFIQRVSNHINQPDSDTWRQWVGPHVPTLFASNDMCRHPIGQPPSNENMPLH
jgi:hypothetical protein